ncbi:protein DETOXIFICATION 51-like [Canna indica]|uniref:Protein DETOXIFICATION 51-like n=1 Tax=Canna indica TaxID=4628 RepID=A0AAQ3Q6H3_9LILI|nr:protein DETOXIFICATION 51-like [Canna indica]
MCNTSSTAASMSSPGDNNPLLPPHLYLDVLPLSIPPPSHTNIKALLPLPSPSEALREANSILRLSFPIALTATLIYSRSALSMIILGAHGDLPLAAGSLAIAFANITGYSVLSGLSLGMEPLCSQAFGAHQPHLLAQTFHRCVLFLLCSALPIALLWLNMSGILLFLGQDPEVVALAQTYLLLAIPDLVSFSLIHPIRIYLRSQGVTRPLTVAAAVAAAVHLPANYLFVARLRLGVPGVSAAATISNALVLPLDVMKEDK